MTINQVLMACGSWEITLRPNTPREIVDQLRIRESDTNFSGFGGLICTPVDADPVLCSPAELYRRAFYYGVYRTQEFATNGPVRLSGCGPEMWLGDEDGKGHLRSYLFTSADFEAAHDSIRTLGLGDITKGTYWDPGGDPFEWDSDNKLVSARDVLTYINRHFSSEWRINPDLTYDAGERTAMYGTTPAAIFAPNAYANEPGLPPVLGGTATHTVTVEDFAQFIDIEGEVSGVPAVGSSSRVLKPNWSDPWNFDASTPAITMRRRAQVNGKWADSASLEAQATGVMLFSEVYQETTEVEITNYEPHLRLLGKDLLLTEPSAGLVDRTADMIHIAGQAARPMTQRVVEMEFGLRPGCGVYLHTSKGTVTRNSRPLIHLSPWIDWTAEARTARITLGRSRPTWEQALRDHYSDFIT